MHVPLENREAAFDPSVVDLLKTARVIFFSGGDQVRITSRLGGSVLCDAIRKFYEAGVTLAGTSEIKSGSPQRRRRGQPPASPTTGLTSASCARARSRRE